MKRDTTDIRFRKMNRWMEEHNAIVVEELAGVGSIVRRCHIDGKSFVVTYFFNSLGQALGWDVYVPASHSNATVPTLEALEKACGLQAEGKKS